MILDKFRNDTQNNYSFPAKKKSMNENTGFENYEKREANHKNSWMDDDDDYDDDEYYARSKSRGASFNKRRASSSYGRRKQSSGYARKQSASNNRKGSTARKKSSKAGEDFVYVKKVDNPTVDDIQLGEGVQITNVITMKKNEKKVRGYA